MTNLVDMPANCKDCHEDELQSCVDSFAADLNEDPEILNAAIHDALSEASSDFFDQLEAAV